MDIGTELDTRHLAEPFGLFRGAKDEDARDDRDLSRCAAAHLDEPAAERREIEDGLCLQEFCACGDLFQRLREIGLHRLREWRRRRADENLRRLFDLVA